MDEQLRSEIKEIVERSVEGFFRRRKKTSIHVLDRLFPVERRIRSIVGGLETSMGTTVWEPIAKALAKWNGFTLRRENIDTPTYVPDLVARAIKEVNRAREMKGSCVPLSECVEVIREAVRASSLDNLAYTPRTAGSGVDLYFVRMADGKEFAFDLKTNQINRAGGVKFNQQLIDWYAFRFCKNPDADFEAHIAMPFNPYEPKTWWRGNGGRAHPLVPGDIWIEDEFWNFCSGQEGTWNEILDIFDELAKNNFGSRFHNIIYPK